MGDGDVALLSFLLLLFKGLKQLGEGQRSPGYWLAIFLVKIEAPQRGQLLANV